jgi:hypothetical protein
MLVVGCKVMKEETPEAPESLLDDTYEHLKPLKYSDRSSI